VITRDDMTANQESNQTEVQEKGNGEEFPRSLRSGKSAASHRDK
jgi:hypothetical protein